MFKALNLREIIGQFVMRVIRIEDEPSKRGHGMKRSGEKLTRESVLEMLRDNCSNIAAEIISLPFDKHVELYFLRRKLIFSEPMNRIELTKRPEKIGSIHGLNWDVKRNIKFCVECQRWHYAPKGGRNMMRGNVNHNEDAYKELFEEIEESIGTDPSGWMEET